MYDHHPTILSSNDYARLQGLMCTLIGSPTPLAALLRRKLGSAVIMLPSDAGPDLATSGRRVRFTIDGNQAAEQALVWERPARGGDSELWLRSPRGLALLGLRIGDSVSYQADNGRTEHLTVEFVFSDEEPEAQHLDGGADAARHSYRRTRQLGLSVPRTRVRTGEEQSVGAIAP